MNRMFSKREFLKVVDRERVRSERTGQNFSVILLDLGMQRKKKSILKAAGNLIRKKIRVYDEIGWFDTDRLGVLLPDTPYAGAETLALKIKESIIPDGIN